jgi:hypothetical protein
MSTCDSLSFALTCVRHVHAFTHTCVHDHLVQSVRNHVGCGVARRDEQHARATQHALQRALNDNRRLACM